MVSVSVWSALAELTRGKNKKIAKFKILMVANQKLLFLALVHGHCISAESPGHGGDGGDICSDVIHS